MKTFCVLALALTLSAASSRSALGQWSTSPVVNNPVCTTVPRQYGVWVVSDHRGGAIMCWQDYDPNTGDDHIYAQRITANGTLAWPGSITVCTAPSYQSRPKMVSDGAGGAVLAWQDNRSGVGDIYAQRVDADGVVRWGGNGKIVCGAANFQAEVQLLGDGSGGTIFVWMDLRHGGHYRPYAQRLDANGSELWAPDGVELSPNTAEGLGLVSDGAGGAIIAWHQYVSGQFDIYSQRILGGGTLDWGTSGQVICALPSDALRAQITGDGGNGGIIVWQDRRNGTNYNLYAQRVNPAGAVQWTLNGVRVGSNPTHQADQRLLGDGLGGAYVTWVDAEFVPMISAQRLDSSGSASWGSSGITLISAQYAATPEIATDGGGGAIVTWYDFRAGNGDVFAQRLDAAGTPMWTAGGADVCRHSAGQVAPRLAATGAGRVIIAWADERNGPSGATDIYAQQLGPTGMLGDVADVTGGPGAAGSELQNHPNPFRLSTVIEYVLPRAEPVRIAVYDAQGHRVASLVDGARGPGRHEVRWNAAGRAPGMYFYRLETPTACVTRKLILLK